MNESMLNNFCCCFSLFVCAELHTTTTTEEKRMKTREMKIGKFDFFRIFNIRFVFLIVLCIYLFLVLSSSLTRCVCFFVHFTKHGIESENIRFQLFLSFAVCFIPICTKTINWSRLPIILSSGVKWLMLSPHN
jgi:hypothetical protein